MGTKAAILVLLGLAALVLALLVVPGGSPSMPAATPQAASTGNESGARTGPAVFGTSSSGEGLSTSAARPPAKAAVPARPDAVAGASSRDREKNMMQLAMRLAALPVAEALARLAEMPDQESRDMAMVALLSELSGRSSLELIRSGDVWRFGAGGALAVHLLESGNITPAQAASLAQQNSDGNRRGDLFARIGARLAADDPGAAVALGNGLEAWDRQRFLEGLAESWGGESPDAARRWITGVTDASTRDALLSGLLQAELRGNPAAAAASFAATPPGDQAVRARTAMRIAGAWASKDTLAAMQWAETLPGDAERSAAQQGVRNAAPVGIGAMLTRGSDGLPVVGKVVPGSPAGASGALQTGDSLLAVSDANGAWVDTRGLSTRDLLDLVRGQPNTQVSLQVRSPGSTVPRVITLGRQQIIFRPQ